jgi:hypothetical protein
MALAPEQIATLKDQIRAGRKANERWSEQIKKWRIAIASEDSSRRLDALADIEKVADVTAIPSLDGVALDLGGGHGLNPDDVHAFATAWISALVKMKDHGATESLLRHAVMSPLSDIRARATVELRERPLHDFVPQMLSALAPAIESSFEVVTTSDGSVHYSHSLLLQGTEQVVKLNSLRTARQFDVNGRTYLHGTYSGRTIDTGRHRQSSESVAASMANVASRSRQKFGNEALRIEQQVAAENQASAAYNERLISVLANVTEQNFGNNPKAWADWWQGYNEYYREGPPPEYEQNYVQNQNYYYRLPELYYVYDRPNMSCFAKGTPVWTKTGQKPIESLQLGDLVLSQNIDTGELCYKPIIGRTVRPPSEILKLSFGSDELLTTKGHPLWVEGVGWRMAKELGDGAVLHAVTASQQVKSVESAGKDEAFNLVVADNNTYFVGEKGLLVHDNTPRKPTRAKIPGLILE